MDSDLAHLADAGFDLVHPFDTYTAAIEPGWECLAHGDRLGLLIGNTRALWPRFLEAMADTEIAGHPHPLQRYTARTIEAVFPTAKIFYSHDRYGEKFLPFVRLAVATGLAAMAPSQLSIHPIYGPWFALRAVVVIEGDPPPRSLPLAKPCTCDARCGQTLEVALTSQRWEDWLAVRDACRLRAWRYSDDQIRYHYTRAFAGRDEGPRSP